MAVKYLRHYNAMEILHEKEKKNPIHLKHFSPNCAPCASRRRGEKLMHFLKKSLVTLTKVQGGMSLTTFTQFYKLP